MIYTLTLSPAIDYTQWVKKVVRGSFNRGYKESYLAGGKGINISIILRRLGVHSIALGFLGGFTGEHLKSLIEFEKVETKFIGVFGNTRVNTKVIEDDGTETDVNGVGPEVTPDKMNELYFQLEGLKDGDVLVLSGQVPPKFPQDTYEQIMKRLQGKDITFFVDAQDKLVTDCLTYKPFLIKNNLEELEEITGKKFLSDEEIFKAMNDLQKKGAQNVFITKGKDGALLLSEDGQRFSAGAMPGKVVSTFAAGDAAMAGFLFGWTLYRNYDYAIKLAMATSQARVFSGRHPTRDEVMHYYHLMFDKKN